MIRLYPTALSAPTIQTLSQYQQTVLNAGLYTDQADAAGAEFGRRNKKNNRAFKEVKQALTAMCIGARRCNYCEDSVADEVEHIAPKTLYPERCFDWDNYCYACGSCNGPKNNKYAVIKPDGTVYKIPSHKKTVRPYTTPPAGMGALVNPRLENPLKYLYLDVLNTFFFSPLADEGTSDYDRAHYTIDLLGLNSRSFLVKARRIAYTNFRARVREYIQQEQQGVPPAQLNTLRQNLGDEQHQTVWQEMKRQRHAVPELTTLFQQLPDPQLWDLAQNDGV